MFGFIIATTGYAFQKIVPVKSSSTLRGILHEPLAYAEPECSIGSVDVIAKNEGLPPGYEVASSIGADEHLSALKSKLDAVENVVIARLTDGEIKGSYYGYELVLKEPDMGLGHVAIICNGSAAAVAPKATITTIAPTSTDSNCQDKGDLCDSQPPFSGLCDDGIYYNWIEEYNGEYFSYVCPARCAELDDSLSCEEWAQYNGSATTEAPTTTTDKVEPTATTKEATNTLDGNPTDVVTTEVPVRTPDGTTEEATNTLDGTPTDVVTTEVPVRTPDGTTEERTTSLSVTTAEANTTVAVIPRCTHYEVLVEKKRFHGEALPEGFHVANSVEAIKYLAEFVSKRIDGYHVELVDGFISHHSVKIVDYVFPTHDDTYGNSGYTYEGLISDICSPVVPAINIVDCYSDCARVIRKEEQIPQGFHQASSAEANAFREEIGSYMGTVEIAELTDAQFMGSEYDFEIKMTINPKYNTIGIVRDF